MQRFLSFAEVLILLREQNITLSSAGLACLLQSAELTNVYSPFDGYETRIYCCEMICAYMGIQWNPMV